MPAAAVVSLNVTSANFAGSAGKFAGVAKVAGVAVALASSTAVCVDEATGWLSAVVLVGAAGCWHALKVRATKNTTIVW